MPSTLDDKSDQFHLRPKSIDELTQSMNFLRENPDDSRGGEIFASLLHAYINEDLEDLAAEWLLKHGLEDPGSAVYVASEVLESHRHEQVLAVCRALISKIDDANFSLVQTMLRLDPAPLVESVALEMLHDEVKCFRTELLVCNILERDDKFEEEVGKFALKNKSRMRAFLAGFTTSPSIAASRILLKYLRRKHKPKVVFDALSHSLDFCKSAELLEFAWDWFKKHRSDPESIYLLESILRAQYSNPPTEATDIAFEWCLSNPADKLWARMLSCVLDRAPSPERIAYAKSNMVHCILPVDELRILITLIQNDRCDESWDMVIHWLRDTENRSWMSHRTGLAEHAWKHYNHRRIDLVPSSRGATLSHRGTKQLPHSSRCLLKLVDTSTYRSAWDWLSTPRLEPRWSCIDVEKGKLLVALLYALPGDQNVLTRSARWLQRDMRFFDEVREDVQKAYDHSKCFAAKFS